MLIHKEHRISLACISGYECTWNPWSEYGEFSRCGLVLKSPLADYPVGFKVALKETENTDKSKEMLCRLILRHKVKPISDIFMSAKRPKIKA